jgi:hypothetical protein
MPRIKQVLEIVRRRYAKARGVRTKKGAPSDISKNAGKSAAPRGIEITRAVFPRTAVPADGQRE